MNGEETNGQLAHLIRKDLATIKDEFLAVKTKTFCLIGVRNADAFYVAVELSQGSVFVV